MLDIATMARCREMMQATMDEDEADEAQEGASCWRSLYEEGERFLFAAR